MSSRSVDCPSPETSRWRHQAEQERGERDRRLHREAVRRLRRIEAAAQRDRELRLAVERELQPNLPIVLDSERFAAPFLERIGARGRVQLLLWSLMAAVGGCTIFSFFTAPLMELSTAMSAVLVMSMLILSYVM